MRIDPIVMRLIWFIFNMLVNMQDCVFSDVFCLILELLWVRDLLKDKLKKNLQCRSIHMLLRHFRAWASPFPADTVSVHECTVWSSLTGWWYKGGCGADGGRRERWRWDVWRKEGQPLWGGWLCVRGLLWNDLKYTHITQTYEISTHYVHQARKHTPGCYFHPCCDVFGLPLDWWSLHVLR